MEESQSSPPPAVDLASLEPDAFAAVCQHLHHRDVAALASSAAGLRHAVASNDTLWSGLYSRQFPEPWQRLTQPLPQPPQQQQQQPYGKLVTTTVGGWRDAFLRSHTACQQLRSSAPACRQWTTDSTPVHMASIHGSGTHRLTLAAQGSTVELRSAPSAGRQAGGRSIQCYGHTARVSAAAVIELAGAVRRVGIATASHDQTIRLWAAAADPESYRPLPLTLLTPLRTLRGHGEAVTCLQLISGSTGVTIAATGSKDRTVRLWGLAPLLPSPVQKPQVAILRGHGGPVTCLAVSGGCELWADGGGWDGNAAASSASPAAATVQLLSGSLDGRVKSWDPWTASCIGTAKCAAQVTALQAVAANPTLQPHAMLVSSASGVQLLDSRLMRGVAAVAFPAGRSEQVHSCAQWGWDLAVGSSGGARVFDMRVLTASGDGGSSSSSSSSGTLRERLRLNVDARPVTSIHVDRWKVLTATDRYGEAPLRAWCVSSGDCLAELESCLPAAAPALGNASPGQPVAEADGSWGQLQLETGNSEQEEEGLQAEVSPSTHQPSQEHYRAGWAGVTALACRGALLATGNSDGTVCERDYSRGGFSELDGGRAAGGAAAESSQLAGKFWRYNVLEP
ncbi:hypothetical protein D9Q98_004651 [Chlorella vulgaris]|uniref:Uncharacterized protein n=1 Tax=Chlorella vulgaris TaxID=3077 RepID=A0A9D4TQ42_CHLVU|nr:hypothetical protein D9Q98_004651 [Chlorella vulgaris]